jgi:hypothetical protein
MRNIVCVVVFAATNLLAAEDAAAIVKSGSINTAGFRIVVERSGKASYTQMPRPGEGSMSKPKSQRVPKELARRFYKDLEAGKPLSELPHQGCMKSASFGTTLTIEFAGQTSPDLSCGDGGNAAVKALIQDSNDIVKAVNGK